MQLKSAQESIPVSHVKATHTPVTHTHQSHTHQSRQSSDPCSGCLSQSSLLLHSTATPRPYHRHRPLCHSDPISPTLPLSSHVTSPCFSSVTPPSPYCSIPSPFLDKDRPARNDGDCLEKEASSLSPPFYKQKKYLPCFLRLTSDV